MEKIQVKIDDKELTLSNLEKIFWPESNITKAALIRYYQDVSPFLLPHLKYRPLTMNRFPNGILGKSFYQKDCPDSAPDWIITTPVASSETKTINYILADHPATIIWMANLGCIEMHPWLSTYQTPNIPTAMVFDLDPNEGTGLPEVLQLAPLIREGLKQFDIKGFVKTSGASGLHIYVPLEPRYTFRQVQTAAKTIARAVCRLLPDIATIERTVKKRGARVYIDCLQNAYGKTIASVYSLRPHPGAPVSFPVPWNIVEKGQVNPLDYEMRNVPSLLKKKGDMFQETLVLKQSIENLLQAK